MQCSDFQAKTKYYMAEAYTYHINCNTGSCFVQPGSILHRFRCCIQNGICVIISNNFNDEDEGDDGNSTFAPFSSVSSTLASTLVRFGGYRRTFDDTKGLPLHSLDDDNNGSTSSDTPTILDKQRRMIDRGNTDEWCLNGTFVNGSLYSQ